MSSDMVATSPIAGVSRCRRSATGMTQEMLSAASMNGTAMPRLKTNIAKAAEQW